MHSGLWELACLRWRHYDLCKSLLKRHTRPSQPGIRRRHQPHWNTFEVVAHAAFIREAFSETTGDKEVGKPRYHPTHDVHATASTGGQDVIARHPAQPDAELVQYFHRHRIAGQARRRDGFGGVEHRLMPIHRTNRPVQPWQAATA